MMDRKQVYTWWSLFHQEDDVIEVRVIGEKNYSGYYKDVENLIRDIEPIDNLNGEQIYFTLNTINPDCYGRSQNERLSYMGKTTPTTSDNDIVGRKWIMIDLDPKRPAGTSSTNEQVEKAHLKAVEVYKFLKANGFSEPVVAMSGNGFHLDIPCKMAISDANDAIIKRFGMALAMMFDDEYIEVDKKVHNRARLCKLYGTTAKKGTPNLADRPWRVSHILKYPDEIVPTDIAYFKKIADLYPEDAPKPSSDNNWGKEKFDLVSFLDRHGIRYTAQRVADGTKYVLEHCVFNEQHKGKDAAIFQRDNGAIAYVCFHSSCSQYTWKDVRLKFEPDAYDKKDYQEYQFKRRYDYRHQFQPEPFKPIEETEEKGKVWLKMSEIKKPLFSFNDFIPSGITELDRRGVGFKRGMVSVWTGKRGCGKSSLLNMLILNAAQKGFKSALWTGELTDSMAKTWIYLQAAGKQYNERQYGTDYFVTPEKIADRIDPWIDKYFWLFNNKYGDNFKQIEEQVRKLVKESGIDVVIFDNLMTLDIRMLDENKYDRQGILLQSLEDLAKELNIHIHLVAHPHKSLAYIQVDNISGSGDISNKADNIFVLSRVDTAFKQNAKEYMSAMDYQDIIDSGCTNVIEVGKFRSKGTLMGSFFKLWFEEESNRLKNNIAESIVYGWEEPPHQETLPYNDSQPYVASKEEPIAPPTIDDGFVPPVAGCPF